MLANLKTLYHLTLAPVRGDTHQQRMENFYASQAGHYDAFRDKLLHGRAELFSAIQAPEGAVWLDVGGATGANIEHCAPQLPRVSKVWIVDLSPSLLKIAEDRIKARGWRNVQTLQADATNLDPPQRPVDVITFSYSLTMIPDWCAALERAFDLLKPGGIIGVVDFYVSHKYPPPARAKHGWLTRTFWPAWFACDNADLSPDRLTWLLRKFQTIRLDERHGPLPWLPFTRVPFFTFIGRKPGL